MYESVLARFAKLRKLSTGKGWTACCPAHDDEHPSLNLWVDGAGKLSAQCMSRGCRWLSIVQASGTKASDWFPDGDSPVNGNNPIPKIVKCYDYRDSSGRLLYQRVRYEP